MVEHYGNVNGSALAAAVTYFAFLSFFPILALAFAIFGQVAKVYDNAEDTSSTRPTPCLPGLIGGENGVSLDTLQRRGARGSSASASCSRSTPASAGSPACATR